MSGNKPLLNENTFVFVWTTCTLSRTVVWDVLSRQCQFVGPPCWCGLPKERHRKLALFISIALSFRLIFSPSKVSLEHEKRRLFDSDSEFPRHIQSACTLLSSPDRALLFFFLRLKSQQVNYKECFIGQLPNRNKTLLLEID